MRKGLGSGWWAGVWAVQFEYYQRHVLVAE